MDDSNDLFSTLPDPAPAPARPVAGPAPEKRVLRAAESGDGYSAGYYSYMWSEVLDADAFRAFTEKGDPFDSKTAKKLKKHIYSAGGSADPEKTYKAFRGKLPSPEAMLEGRGLL